MVVLALMWGFVDVFGLVLVLEWDVGVLVVDLELVEVLDLLV